LPPLIIAHRGNSAHRPENTLAAFASALEVGADVIELDVQLTRDGRLAVIHDATLDRTTSGRGRVRDHSLQQIRELSAGYRGVFGDAYPGERVPTLGDALGFLKGRARVLIEVKLDPLGDASEAGVEELCVHEVQRAGMTGDVALVSFDRRAIERFRAIAPEVRRGHLFQRASADEVVAGARAVDCDLVLLEKGMLSDALFDAVRAAGFRVGTWLVDDPAELRALCRYDLFAVATNRPGELIEATLETE
jgi:glycerophosphoryl diester phosphodiesterase